MWPAASSSEEGIHLCEEIIPSPRNRWVVIPKAPPVISTAALSTLEYGRLGGTAPLIVIKGGGQVRISGGSALEILRAGLVAWLLAITLGPGGGGLEGRAHMCVCLGGLYSSVQG